MQFQPDIERMDASARADVQVRVLRDLVARLRTIDHSYWGPKLAGIQARTNSRRVFVRDGEEDPAPFQTG